MREKLALTHSRDRVSFAYSRLCRLCVDRKFNGGLPVGEPVLSRVYQARGRHWDSPEKRLGGLGGSCRGWSQGRSASAPSRIEPSAASAAVACSHAFGAAGWTFPKPAPCMPPFPAQVLSDGMLGYQQARKIEDTPFPFPYAQVRSRCPGRLATAAKSCRFRLSAA